MKTVPVPRIVAALILPSVIALSLPSCSSTQGRDPEIGRVYPEDTIEPHTIALISKVPVDRSSGRVGGTIGSVAGSMGGGIVGSLVGGLIGPFVEKGMTRKTAKEYTLRTATGTTLSVVQMPDGNRYHVGQRVDLVRSARTGTAFIRPSSTSAVPQ